MRRGAEVAAAALAALAVGVAAPCGRRQRRRARRLAGRRRRGADRPGRRRAGRPRHAGDPAPGRAGPGRRRAGHGPGLGRGRSARRPPAASSSRPSSSARPGPTPSSATCTARPTPATSWPSCRPSTSRRDDAVWGLATLEVSSHGRPRPGPAGGQGPAPPSPTAWPRPRATSCCSTTARDRRAQELDAADRAARPRWPPASTASCSELGQATVERHVHRGLRRVPQGRGHAGGRAAGLRRCAGSCWPPSARPSPTTACGRLDVFGNSLVPIIGIPIGGDTDGGALDGDPEPRPRRRARCSSSPRRGASGAPTPTATAKADPGNIVDAATAAGRYLCRAAGDLTLRHRGRGDPGDPLLQPEPDLPAGRGRPVRGPRQRPRPRLVQRRRPPARTGRRWPDVAPNAGPDGREATGNSAHPHRAAAPRPSPRSGSSAPRT